MERILIVEDSATQREMLHHILEKQGYSVRSAADGVTAWSTIFDPPPTIVVTDIVMPGMDGYALCRAIKEEPKLANVPVMLLTSLSDPKDVIAALESGADGFIGKPFAEDHLLSRIRDVITNRDLKRRGDDTGGVEINYGGRTHMITAERRQILDLLLSVYEVAMRRNAELAQAQANLRKLNSELEQQVRNRTHRLEESNQSLETFCYSVAHDLRAPLRSIQGYVSMLNEEAVQLGSNVTQTYADRARSAANRMDRMIVDLLAYGRVSHANTPFEWVDLRTKVDRVVAEFSQDISSKAARVQVEVDNIRIFTSRVLLAQVLSNLLGNALKFVRPNEPPDVTIIGRLAPLGQAVQIEVRDRGIGIDLSYREKMFKLFEKLHSGAFPGTGIGLAIVQKAVQRLGGSISVDAVEGGGTRFIVLLPLGNSNLSL